MNYRLLSISCWITWFSFILFLILDSMNTFGLKDIGLIPTLEQSAFARGMFFDIGVLSTIIAAWIAFGTKVKFRYLFALAALFVGGGAILPFSGIYFWKKDLSERNSE